METPILDVFIISLLERGIETPYDLNRQGGISLGASTPALKRLIDNKLIRRITEPAATKRRTHRYTLTEAGRELAHQGGGRISKSYGSRLTLIRCCVWWIWPCTTN